MAAAPAPDFVMFNGVANQYKDAPIEVGTGESVRVFVLNAGPSIDSSFHVVGTIFDTVVKEGVWLHKGNEGNWGSQAVDSRSGPGRDRGVHDRRGRPVPDGHPRLQLRRSRRARPVPGR
jgi:nitrite reductase (NO-forming)